MGTITIILSVLLLVFVIDKLVNGNGTSTQAFLNGYKYNYDFEGTVNIYLNGSSNQETGIKLIGQASVTPVGNSMHELSVHNLVIFGPDGKEHQSPSGIERQVRFSLQDGRLGAEISTEEGDTQRSLNIKRAIISLLQTEQKSSIQVDIFGTCPTEVTSSQHGDIVLIYRNRDLGRCGHHEQDKNDLISGIFGRNTEIKDTQVLRSNMNVETKVISGVPEKVTATEEYLYRPFSVGEKEAKAIVHTKLTLTGKAKATNTPPSQCTVSRTIIFENPHGSQNSKNNMDAALNAVKETAKTCATEASSKSAGNFAQLVRTMRSCSKNDLMGVYGLIKNNNLEKRVYLDGLLRAGTGPSIETSFQLLKNNELGLLEQKLVFLSLDNARHVTNETLKAAASILDMPNLPKEAYFGFGRLIRVFCREHQCYKDKNDGVTIFRQKFAAMLQDCCLKTKVDEDNVVAILKGIRNIYILEDNLIDKLSHCALDNNVRPRVKAAILEAFQANACASKLKKTAINIMKNRQLDSEIRIKAYLAVIACPCSQSASEIKHLLESEPVHQVGNFISTSLRNIRSSSNPDKQLARQHYGDIRIPKRFKSDIRKYSFSVEESFGLLGLEGNIEYDIIYSQDSLLPRSIGLNMTAKLFGHNFNVLEVGVRQGNLDRIAERLLGPKGFFRTENSLNICNKYIMTPLTDHNQEAESTVARGRRSVKSNINNFDKKFKAESTTQNKELDLDLYIKLFGTDAVFLSLGNGVTFDKVLDQFMQYANKGIDEVKSFQQEFRAHLLFLDAELAYPTSTGLLLKLDLIGAAIGRFEATTNIDICQIIKSPQNTKVDIKLVPSTDIEITGALVVDADAFTVGLKVTVNIHSSTGGHVIAKVLENGAGFDLQVDLPTDKLELITASNDLVYFYTEKGQMEKQTVVKTNNAMKEISGCYNKAADFLGISVCGEMTLPFIIRGPNIQASVSNFIANYPLPGFAKIRVMLQKQNLKGYHIKGALRSDPSGKRGFELLFDAEGAKHGHAQMTGEYIYSQREIGAQITLELPLRSISGQISLSNSPSELTMLIKGKYGTKEVYAKVGFNIQSGGGRTVYKPVAEYRMPGDNKKQSIAINGQLIEEVSDAKRKYTIDSIKFNLQNVKEPICINGFITVAGAKDIKFYTTVKDLATLKGSILHNNVSAEFINKLKPHLNFRFKGHFEYDKVIHNEVDLIYGSDLKNKQNRVVLGQLYKYQRTPEKYFDFTSKNNIEIYDAPLKFRVDIHVGLEQIDVEMEAEYNNKKAVIDLHGKTKKNWPGFTRLFLKSELDKDSFQIFTFCSEEDSHHFDCKTSIKSYVEFISIGKYELQGMVLHIRKPNTTYVSVTGNLTKIKDNKSQYVKFNIGMLSSNKLYSSHAKLSKPQGEILDYVLEIPRDTDSNGLLKLVINDTVNANGEFNVTDYKSYGMIVVNFTKIQHKMKCYFKFMAKAPNYGADVDLYLNYDKDKHDKVHFSTNSNITDKLFKSKIKYDYRGKKIELVVHQYGYNLFGKSNSLVEVVLPTNRCLTLKLDRNITKSNNIYNGHAELLLSDAAKRGGAASIINYKGKIMNINWKKNTGNYEGQVEIKHKDGKEFFSNFSVKQSLEGDKRQFDLNCDVNGSMITKPASLSVDYEAMDSKIIPDSKYDIYANYGNDTYFKLNGVWVAKLFEDGDKKYKNDFALMLGLPFGEVYYLKNINNVQFLQADGENVSQFTILEIVQVNTNLYVVEINGNVSPKTSNITVNLLLPFMNAIKLDVNHNNVQKDDKLGKHIELRAKYGEKKTATIAIDTSVAPRDYSLSFKANASKAETFKTLEFMIHSKNPAPYTYVSNVVINANDRVKKIDTNFVFSKANPLIDMKYTSPESPKISRFYVKANPLSLSQGKIEIKIDNIRDICLDVTSEVYIHNDNITIKGTATFAQLGLKNYTIEISSKTTGNDKRLDFHATNDTKNVFSGSTSFISTQEGPNMITEGSGVVKVKEDQQSANFKYTRTILEGSDERGVETLFTIAIGNRSYVSESRNTNLEYKTFSVYCEEKLQCAHAELNSKIDESDSKVIQNIISAGFDLRMFGIAPEFGLTIKEKIFAKKMPQYTMDVHINKEDKKYHLHVYNTLEYGNTKTGVTIQLPQRVVVFETDFIYPTNRNTTLPIGVEVCLDMDKNREGHKTSARLLADFDVSDDRKLQSAMAEFRFYDPNMNKEAVIEVRGDLNRSSWNTVELKSTARISHPALGVDRESKILLESSPTRIHFLVNTPSVKVVDIEAWTTVILDFYKAEMTFCLLDDKPMMTYAIAKDYNYFDYTIGYSGNTDSDHKLSITARINPELRIMMSADILQGEEIKNIVNGALYFDNSFLFNKFLDSGLNVSKDNFYYFLDAVKKDIGNSVTHVRQLGEKADQEAKAVLKRLEPIFTNMQKTYSDDLKELFQVIADNTTLMEISYFFDDIVQYLANTSDEVLQTTSPIVNQISQEYINTTKKIQHIYEKQIEPQVKKLHETFSENLKEYMDCVFDVIGHVTALATDFFEKHKTLREEFTSILNDVTRLLVAQVKESHAYLRQFSRDLTDKLQNLSIVEFIMEKYQELAIPEQGLALLHDAYLDFKALAPTQSIKSFAYTLNGYIIKNLKRDRCHDDDACDSKHDLLWVCRKLNIAVASLIHYTYNELRLLGLPIGPFNPMSFIPRDFPSFPYGIGGVDIANSLNQLLQRHIPKVIAKIKALRSVNPFEEFPAKLRAVIVNGQHIFTFDGRHVTLPGNCTYILAHDHVDRIFTLMIETRNGGPVSIILQDKSGAVIEIKEIIPFLQVAILNGTYYGFPIIEKDVFAIHQTSTHVRLGSLYGIMASCSLGLGVCYVEVSGFYLGKLRGLLGDGNNEPYDDFRLPNGEITESESEFDNSYRLTNSCQEVVSPAPNLHHLHQMALPPACEQVFGGTSPLTSLANILDVAPFRQACIHAITGNSAEDLRKACDLARGYATLAGTGILPDVCMLCIDADHLRQVGESYELRVPNNQADIIVNIETTIDNEKNYKEFVLPLVSEVVKRLGKKGFTSIMLGLVGVTTKYTYPIIYDTFFELNNSKIQFDDKSRYQYHDIDHGQGPVLQAAKMAARLYNDIAVELGLTNVIASYPSITELPLRAGAIIHTINVVGDECLGQNLLLDTARLLVYKNLFENKAYTHSIIAATPLLKIEGRNMGPNIVGYTKRSVIIRDMELGEKSENLRSDLQKTPDVCRDFVESTDGIVFSATNFHKIASVYRSQYIRTAAAAIEQRMFHETMIQQCTCSYVDPFRARSVCVSKDRKEVPRQ